MIVNNKKKVQTVASDPVKGSTLPLIPAPPILTANHSSIHHKRLGEAHALNSSNMALWTPYADEALDLTKQNVKIEKPNYYQHSLSSDSDYYNYVEPYRVPTSQISPDSIKSWNQTEFYDAESLSEDMEYQAFERDALQAMAERNGGSLLGNNPKMKRAVQTTQAADEMYKKQRERNNFAAKQSRDRRKLREVRLAFQVTFLKKKLAQFKARLDDTVCTRCQRR